MRASIRARHAEKFSSTWSKDAVASAAHMSWVQHRRHTSAPCTTIHLLMAAVLISNIQPFLLLTEVLAVLKRHFKALEEETETQQIKMRWHHRPLRLQPALLLPQFDIISCRPWYFSMFRDDPKLLEACSSLLVPDSVFQREIPVVQGTKDKAEHLSPSLTSCLPLCHTRRLLAL